MTSIYITGEIDYDLIETVQEALNQDTQAIHVYINSGGGCGRTGLAVYDMLSDDPRVTIHVRGLAASAAGIIALATPRITYNTNSEFMFHKASRDVGFVNENESQLAVARLKHVDKNMRKILKGVLNPDELQQFDDGKDVWLTGKQLKKRLQAKE